MERTALLVLAGLAALAIGVPFLSALLGVAAAAILDFFAFGGHA